MTIASRDFAGVEGAESRIVGRLWRGARVSDDNGC